MQKLLAFLISLLLVLLNKIIPEIKSLITPLYGAILISKSTVKWFDILLTYVSQSQNLTKLQLDKRILWDKINTFWNILHKY